MTTKIQLTPGELKAQAAEMKALEAEYSSLFAGVTSELKKINGNWSPNLSNNFEGKINSAQKSFMQITQELMNGSKVADTCAVTFETVDSQLAKLYCGDDALAANGESFWDVVKDELSQIPEDIETLGGIFDWIDEKIENIPDEVKGVVRFIESMLPEDIKSKYKTLKKAVEFTGDLLQGDVDFDSVLDLGRHIGKSSPYVLGVIEAFDYTFDKGIERSDEMQAELEAQIKEGDILGVVFDGAEGFIDTIIGGAVECLAKVGGSAVDSALGKVPVVGSILNEGCKYITGLMTGGEQYSIGDLVGESGVAVSELLDATTDVITDITDIATDGMINGVKSVVSWVGGLFD